MKPSGTDWNVSVAHCDILSAFVETPSNRPAASAREWHLRSQRSQTTKFNSTSRREIVLTDCRTAFPLGLVISRKFEFGPLPFRHRLLHSVECCRSKNDGERRFRNFKKQEVRPNLSGPADSKALAPRGVLEAATPKRRRLPRQRCQHERPRESAPAGKFYCLKRPYHRPLGRERVSLSKTRAQGSGDNSRRQNVKIIRGNVTEIAFATLRRLLPARILSRKTWPAGPEV